ncbi:MAG: hypothetical protein ACRBHB_18180 [Arenicella sp.]
MDYTDASNAVQVHGNPGYADCKPGVEGTFLTANALNSVQSEILNVIEKSGQAPIPFDENNPESYNQLWQAISNRLGVMSDGKPLSIRLHNSQAGAVYVPQIVPGQVDVRCNNLVETSGNFPSGSWTGTRLNITAETAGSFGVYNRLNIVGETGEGAKTYLNGSMIDSYQFNSDAGSYNVIGFTHFVELKDGDYLEFYHSHQTPTPRENQSSYATVYRLLAL